MLSEDVEIPGRPLAVVIQVSAVILIGMQRIHFVLVVTVDYPVAIKIHAV